MDFERIFFDHTELQFAAEILLRCLVMYIIIIVFLRLSGKRGIRQLSIFEVAIILSLGSAAGDPMFTQDLPVFHVLLVFVSIILLYRLTTFWMMKSDKFEILLEGKAIYIVEEGLLARYEMKKEPFSHDEFFAEMRQQSVEHIGQIRYALLETNGMVSILFYAKEDIKYGLPIFPKAYVKVTEFEQNKLYACMKCGQVEEINGSNKACNRCDCGEWALAINTDRH